MSKSDINAAMNLRDWRKDREMPIEAVSEKLGLSKTVRTLLRIERGEVKADADIIEKIAEITDGAVTAQDMHETRLEWLQAKQASENGSAA